ncbi:senescence-associated protein-domain-containing protein [Lineolata rhizophorae]|uniref:Senescence-associated protein-domain-containing protein n=1 Tax=Lineolata rhizophorae TaxID=578093 RepID=A0A6A6NS19_9PEZI|nr:senescence-associated protein-domain-containing protein [Lineolata rhizophorae]
MAGHHDPRLLFSLQGIKAYHVQNGEEAPLTPSGPQTLSLLMVPTSSPFADHSVTRGQDEAPEEDFYLHLNLPPELDLPLPATTQIYHQPPRSYLIPRWDLGPDSGAFTRIEFPPVGSGMGKVSQEDIDTFETILAQCTAFLERAMPPNEKSAKPYNPAEYAPGEAYAHGTGKPSAGQIVLVDEDNGSVVGELADGADVVEDPKLKHGSKNPVEIQISPSGNRIDVRPISEDYLRMARHPAYKESSMVQNAAAASRLIVTGSSYLSSMMSSSADSFTQRTKPNPEPMTFKPTTHDHVRKIHNFTLGAASISAKTVGQASKYAQNIGATLAGRGQKKEKAFDKDGKPIEEYKPGFLNKSMIAFSTLADGIAVSGKSLLTTGTVAASTVVGHRYGAEAGSIASELAGGVKNVGLVYIDVTGVSRRAVIKSVAKGMVVGKVKGGGEIVVGGGDGGVVPEEDLKQGGVNNDNLGQGQSSGSSGPGLVGYGNAVPPSYSSSGIGEPLGSQGLQGQNLGGKF